MALNYQRKNYIIGPKMYLISHNITVLYPNKTENNEIKEKKRRFND